MKNINLIKKYTNLILKEMRRRRRGGRPSTSKSASSRTEAKSGPSENTHKALILSVLNDLVDWDEVSDTYQVSKDFLAFERISQDGIGFQRKYVEERFFSINDMSELNIYNNSRRGKESVNIGKEQTPFEIPIVYVLASDIVENSEGLNKNSLKRRYSGAQGYMFTSTLTREKIRKSFRHLGLSAVGIDIVNIDDTEDIHRKFVRQFNKLGWKDTLRELGYTPGVSEYEATRILNQNKGTRRDRDADSVSKRNDLLGIMSSHSPNTYFLNMNKQEFDDMIENFSYLIGGEAIFTFKWVVEEWKRCANISEAEIEEIVNLSMSGNYEQCQIEIRKFMARGYNNFIDNRISDPRSQETVSTKVNKDIEVDEQGYPTNLNDVELTNYYGAIYRYVNFAELVLPSIIAKSKKTKQNPGSSFGMSSPPVPAWAARGNTAFDRAFAKSWRRNYR